MSGEPLHVLVVEDDDVDRERIRRTCHALGRPVTVEDVGTVQEALQRLRTAAFDCVLLDYDMGGESSHRLIRRARSLRG